MPLDSAEVDNSDVIYSSIDEDQRMDAGLDDFWDCGDNLAGDLDSTSTEVDMS